MEFIVDSVDKTINIGKKIGALVHNGDIICLNGDLGSGKTHLTKGIAMGLGIFDNITSPTFTIVNEYEGRIKLYHFDVYRVNDPDEISEMGFDEYIFGEGVSVIEWSDYIKEIIPEECIRITIIKIPESDDTFRKIIIEYNGDRYNYLKEIE